MTREQVELIRVRIMSEAYDLADRNDSEGYNSVKVMCGEVLELIGLAVAAEREACAEKTGEFARKWWSIHCATNKHMETTRKAHDDFCALQVAIRKRGEEKT